MSPAYGQKFPSNNEIFKDTMSSDLDLVLLILKAGGLVELPAEGYSMFPAFCPGERFVVRSVGVEERLERGMVVVGLRKGTGHRAQSAERRAQGEDILVMHRLVEIRKNDNGETLFITRGDSRLEPDEPWRSDEIIGVVTGRRTGGRVKIVKVFLPGVFRRKVNRFVLWGWWKIRRVRNLKFKVQSLKFEW